MLSGVQFIQENEIKHSGGLYVKRLLRRVGVCTCSGHRCGAVCAVRSNPVVGELVRLAWWRGGARFFDASCRALHASKNSTFLIDQSAEEGAGGVWRGDERRSRQTAEVGLGFRIVAAARSRPPVRRPCVSSAAGCCGGCHRWYLTGSSRPARRT